MMHHHHHKNIMLLLLVVVVASREERRTFGLTIIIVSFSSRTLSLSLPLLFSLCYFCLVVVVVVIVEQKRRNCGADRSEKFGGKILSHARCKKKSKLREYKIFHLQY
jgi:hypothetical protein